MARLSGLLLDAAAVGVSLLDRTTGTMPAGDNGPWDDAVTPLRNTSHWTICFFDAWERTGDERFFDAATTCLDALCRDDARPHGHTFHHRTEPGKDRCNGLVGQAWTLEALAVADRFVTSERPHELAREVFCRHPYDQSTNLWHAVEPDGTVNPPFGTVNQQCWFAAVGALLCRDGAAPTVRNRVDAFLDALPDTLRTYRNGVVYHDGYPYTDVTFLAHRAVARATGHDERVAERAVGYHSFVLYALAVAHEALPDHPLWDTGFVDGLLAPLDTTAFRERLATNRFAYDYNPAGIEFAYALDVFRDGAGADAWLTEQFEQCYDPDSRLLTGGDDDETLAARLYEATRLRDREVRVPALDAGRVETTGDSPVESE